MGIEELKDSAADIAAMTDAAATTFYDCAVKFGVGKYPRGGIKKARSWNTFLKIARGCLASGVPVEAFVEGAFTTEVQKHSVVAPSDILRYSPKSFTKSNGGASDEASASAGPIEMWNLLSCKLLDMVFSLEGIRDKRELLDNPMYGFPAWFRVFSPERPIGDIIVHWGDLAHAEMKENPTLDSYLKKRRPDTYGLLREVVKRLKGKSK